MHNPKNLTIADHYRMSRELVKMAADDSVIINDSQQLPEPTQTLGEKYAALSSDELLEKIASLDEASKVVVAAADMYGRLKIASDSADASGDAELIKEADAEMSEFLETALPALEEYKTAQYAANSAQNVPPAPPPRPAWNANPPASGVPRPSFGPQQGAGMSQPAPAAPGNESWRPGPKVAPKAPVAGKQP